MALATIIKHIASNLVFRETTKQIETHFHFFIKNILFRDITTSFVGSNDN